MSGVISGSFVRSSRLGPSSVVECFPAAAAAAVRLRLTGASDA